MDTCEESTLATKEVSQPAKHYCADENEYKTNMREYNYRTFIRKRKDLFTADAH